MTWIVYSCLAGSSYQVPGILQTNITHLKRTVLMTCTLPNGPSKEYTEILERKAIGQTLPGTGSFGVLVQRRHICLFFTVRSPNTLLDYPPPKKKNHTHKKEDSGNVQYSYRTWSICTVCTINIEVHMQNEIVCILRICRMKLYVYWEYAEWSCMYTGTIQPIKMWPAWRSLLSTVQYLRSYAD